MNSINFYLLYGDDKAVLNKELDNLKKSLSVSEDDITYYNIEDTASILEEALTISMFSSRKFIEIDSTSYLSDKKEIPNIKLLEDSARIPVRQLFTAKRARKYGRVSAMRKR